jgi:hypothetical protein
MIEIECDVCHRRGKYQRDRPLARIGNQIAPEVLRIIAKEGGCPVALQASEWRCRAHYARQCLPET